MDDGTLTLITDHFECMLLLGGGGGGPPSDILICLKIGVDTKKHV